ncbi:MAG: hypothetical protein EXQ52_16290 [Bryobacterales bacterium]|nr:hypothetical protein [Bryobacterales bacterium]
MMMRRRSFVLTAGVAAVSAHKRAQDNPLLDTLSKHLDLLFDGREVAKLDGKDAEATTAMAFHRMAKITGEARYRDATGQLADRIVKGMRSSPVGLLDIKEWGADKIMYGGPPPLAWYGAYVPIILSSSGRMEDVRFIAGVLDRFPWHDGGWWSSTADVRTGQPLEPLDSPAIINKNCGMAMACAVTSELVAQADAPLAGRLRMRALKCLGNILPAQHSDGYWNYKLSGPEPVRKDTVGYFMLSTNFLIRLRELAPSFRQPALDKALAKAEAFAMKEIAPMTAPNTGRHPARPIGGATPDRYDPTDLPKRSYQLAVLLAHGGYTKEASRILMHALASFPRGDRGQHGSQCVEPASMVAVLLGKEQLAV